MSALQDQRRIVVGVDGSPEALRAIRWAAAEATRRRASLCLVAAVEWTDGGAIGRPGLGYRFGDVVRKQAESNLEDAAAAVSEVDREIEIEQRISVGLPVAVLAEESHHAGLLVVGGGGLGRMASLVVGSVAVGAATRAACPVVVVRGEGHGVAAPVVVGVDASPIGEPAIAFAFDAASVRRVPLIAVHTWGYPPGDVRMAYLRDEFIREGRLKLAERMAGWGEKYPDVPVRRIVSHSHPARRLRELSEDAQLVVVGSRGHGDLAGLVLGSVSNAMVHEAGCPVAVVRSAGS